MTLDDVKRRTLPEGVVWAVVAPAMAISTGGLLWLLWRFLPTHAEQFAALGLNLPLSTRVTLVAANWLLRLMPGLVVLAVVVAGIVVGPLLSGGRRAGRALLLFLMVVTLIEIGFATFILYSVRAAYVQAGLRPPAIESLLPQDGGASAPPP